MRMRPYVAATGLPSRAAPTRGGASRRSRTVATGTSTQGAAPDPAVTTLRGKLERIAVFAGNIDERIDYVTLTKAAERNPRVLFLLVGPKNVHAPEARRAFTQFICRPNARHFDTVPVERLPAIYAACDVGMLPYARNPLLYENGFPLKTFEMVAAGLPIVVQNLKMIEPFAGEGIVYVRDGDGFAAGIGGTSRGGNCRFGTGAAGGVCVHAGLRPPSLRRPGSWSSESPSPLRPPRR